MAPPPQPVTPEMFAELVAELRDDLAEASALDSKNGGTRRARLLARPPGRVKPRTFRDPDRAWWQQRARDLHEVAELTGLAYNSLRRYRTEGNQARADGKETFRSMPAETTQGGWQIGALALWMATRQDRAVKAAAAGFAKGGRWPAQETYLRALRTYLDWLDGRPVSVTATADALGVERTLARKLLRHAGALPHRYSDPEVLAFMRPLAEQEGRRFTQRDLMERLRGAGMNLTDRRVSRLWLQAGGRTPDDGRMDGPDRAGPESLRWDGLLTQHQVAEWFGVSDALVWRARQPRDNGTPPLIKPAKWENGDPLYDRDTLTTRNDMHAGPVRKGHPLAAELGRHHQLRRRIGYEYRRSNHRPGCTTQLPRRPHRRSPRQPGSLRRRQGADGLRGRDLRT